MMSKCIQGKSVGLLRRISSTPSHRISKQTGLRRKLIQQSHRSFASSSSALPDLSLSDTVKSAVLDQAARGDTGIWQADTQLRTNGHHPPTHPTSLEDPTTPLTDPLADINLLHVPTKYWPDLPSAVSRSADPFALTSDEIDSLAQTIREDLLGTDHPVLHKAATYFFSATVEGGKKIRPMMVLLLSRALQHSMNDPHHKQRPDLPAAQRRLAEISELIHTASLFHDDVIDGADIRRGVPAVHTVFGNKTAILAGDYLLARACIGLARMRNVQVVETMSTIIEHLVRGEVMQLRGEGASDGSDSRFDYYLRKNYYKTASLMANSCRSAALLGSYPAPWVEASYRYGKHIGMAFQLIDDTLDFQGNLSQMGKPTLSDLKAGIATAPVLLAASQQNSASSTTLETLMARKFSTPGDVDRAVDLVYASEGIEQTQHLARVHAECAMDALLTTLPPSEHRDALVQLAHHVVARSK